MAIVPFNKSPRVTDQILFDIYTPDAEGCFDNDPATIDTIKIFFISRSATEIKDMVTQDVSVDLNLERKYFEKSQEFCDNPSDLAYEKAKQEAEQLLAASKKQFPTYYSQATPVFCAGDGCMTNVCMSVATGLTRIQADLNAASHGYTFYNTSVGATQDVGITFGIACNSVPIRVIANNTSGNGGVIKIKVTITSIDQFFTVADGASFDQVFSMDEGDEIYITKNANGTTWAQATMSGEIKIGNCNNSDCISGWYQPVWTRGSDNTYSVIKKVTTDTLFPYGHFRFIWIPGIIREGDYYLCYSYTPNTGGNSFSNFIKFYVAANIQNEVAVPYHATPKGKYDKLLDAYTPEMYKLNYANNDMSVETIDNINSSIAKGFTDIEDQASRLIDIMNANATPEPLLPLLAKFFGVKLRSNDITRWRGQLITAVPQFKRKGTLAGLRQALAQAGIKLLNYYQYWQIGTQNSWTEGFHFTGSYDFVLSKISLTKSTDPVAGINIFTVYINPKIADGYSGYVQKSLSLISFNTADGVTTMTWDGSTEPLEIGTYIKVTYQTKLFKTVDEYNLYLYWKDYLILQDDRNELEVTYPPKNFNTRLITKNDSLFTFFIPIANPFVPPVIFGKVRTVFPYSENIYNMDEYNGSLRDSSNPLDIDKNFVDECSGFISSHYGLDVEIDDLSTFRETECREVIADYTPYHAYLRNLTISNNIEEFSLPPVEKIECLISYNYTDNFIAGTGQNVFTRDILTLPSNFNTTTRTPEPVSGYNVFRDALANYLGVTTTGTTDFFNDTLQVVVAANAIQTTDGIVSTNFESIGITPDPNKAILKILAPSTYAGTYNVENPFKNGFNMVAGQISEPVIFSNFAFNLSNKLCAGNFTVSDASLYQIQDESVDFSLFNIKTKFDVDQGFAPAAWKVTLSSGTYDIAKVNNNTIYLINDGNLSNTPATGVTYTIKNASSIGVNTSANGIYKIELLAKIVAANPLCDFLPDLQKATFSPNIYYDNGTTQYKFYGMVESPATGTVGIYVKNMTAPFVPATQSGTIYNRLVEETVGRFKFSGMKILRKAGMPDMIKPEDRITRDQLIPENFVVTLNFGGTDYDYFLDLKNDEYLPASSSYIHLNGKFFTAGVTSPTSATYSFKEFTPKSNVYIRASTANGFAYKLDDSLINFTTLGVKTQQDVINSASVGAWKIKLNDIYYNIEKIVGNELYLEYQNNLDTNFVNDVSYKIYDNNFVLIKSSTTGIYKTEKIPSYVYYIDRSGQDVLQSDTGNSGFPFYLNARDLVNPEMNNNSPVSTVVADDFLSYTIKYKDGGEEKREIR